LNQATARSGLGDRLEEPDGCRGYEVKDPLGQRIGHAEKMFLNSDGRPEYIRVRMGFLRTRSILIPVEGAEVDAEEQTIVLG
jgi:hypothetical protein